MGQSGRSPSRTSSYGTVQGNARSFVFVDEANRVKATGSDPADVPDGYGLVRGDVEHAGAGR
jgi:hypothetical protein